jgi:mRNA interferase RelE/StbE
VASYRILIKPSAARELEQVPRADRLRIVQRIRLLADDPRPPGCEKLSGDDKYRVRQGNYRIIYAIHDRELIVLVVKIGHRKDVYHRR